MLAPCISIMVKVPLKRSATCVAAMCPYQLYKLSRLLGCHHLSADYTSRLPCCDWASCALLRQELPQLHLTAAYLKICRANVQPDIASSQRALTAPDAGSCSLMCACSVSISRCTGTPLHAVHSGPIPYPKLLVQKDQQDQQGAPK